MYAVVAPSGECLYGVMAGVLIGSLVTLVPLYLAAYVHVLNPAVDCTWSACHGV